MINTAGTSGWLGDGDATNMDAMSRRRRLVTAVVLCITVILLLAPPAVALLALTGVLR